MKYILRAIPPVGGYLRPMFLQAGVRDALVLTSNPDQARTFRTSIGAALFIGWNGYTSMFHVTRKKVK